MVKKCCCMYVIGLILIILIPMVPIEPPAEEVPEMVNQLAFTEGITVTNGIASLTDPRNFSWGYSNHWVSNAWWWCVFSENGVNIYLKIYSAPDYTTAEYLEHTYTIPMTNVDGNGGVLRDIVLRCYEDEIYMACSMSWYETVQDDYMLTTRGCRSINGGTGWTDDNWVGVFSNTLDWSNMLDLVHFSANTIYLLHSQDDVADSVVMLTQPGGGGDSASLATGNFNQVYSGNIVGDIYYFTHYSAGWRVGYYNNVSHTMGNLAIFAMDAPAAYTPKVMQYANQSGFELCMDKYYLRTRIPNETVWTKYTAAAPTSAILVIWSADYTRIEFIIWDNKIFIWTEGGSIEKIQEYAGNTTVGQIDAFVDGSEVWSVEYIYANLVKGRIANRVMNFPTAQIECSVKPFSNQWVQYYNNSDELVFKGRVLKDKNDGSKYIYTTISGIEEDFKIKITESYTAKTIHFIIKDIVDKYFNHIWYGTNIDTSNATTFNKTFKGAGFEEVLKWAAQYGGFIGSFLPDYELRLGAFIASGETIADNVSTYGYEEILYEEFHEKFSLIRLYGGYVNGIPLETVAVGEPNQGYWQDTFAHITVQAELDGMAARILADKNVEIIAATFTIAGKNRLNPGDSFTYTSIKRGVTAETWYFIDNGIDIRNGLQVIYATDSFWIPNPTKEEVQSNRITQNEQNIGQISAQIPTDIATHNTTITAHQGGFLKFYSYSGTQPAAATTVVDIATIDFDTKDGGRITVFGGENQYTNISQRQFAFYRTAAGTYTLSAVIYTIAQGSLHGQPVLSISGTNLQIKNYYDQAIGDYRITIEIMKGNA